MTKNEILTEIQGKTFVNHIMATNLVQTLPDETKIWHCEIIEVVDNCAVGRTVPFYELPNGTCYYKDRSPQANIQTFQDKVKPLLKQHNGKIIEQGETWALCETNTLVNTSGVYSIRKDSYFVIDGVPNVTITKIG